MTIALLRSMNDKLETIKMIIVIFAILALIGAVMSSCSVPRSRW